MSPSAAQPSASSPGNGLVLQFRFSGSSNIIETRHLTPAGTTKHVIGRGIQFEQPSEITQSRVLSRKHATLTLNSSGTFAYLVDHESSHGTKVLRGIHKFPLTNRAPFQVKPGDVIKLGKELKKDGQTHKPLYCYVDMAVAVKSPPAVKPPASSSGDKTASGVSISAKTLSIPEAPVAPLTLAPAASHSTNHIKLTEAEQLPDAIEISDDDEDNGREDDDSDDVQVTAYKAGSEAEQDRVPPASQQAPTMYFGSIASQQASTVYESIVNAEWPESSVGTKSVDTVGGGAHSETEDGPQRATTPATQEESLDADESGDEGEAESGEIACTWTEEQKEVMTELADLEEEQHFHERQSQEASPAAADCEDTDSAAAQEVADQTAETLQMVEAEVDDDDDDECVTPPATAPVDEANYAEDEGHATMESDAQPLDDGAVLETAPQEIVVETTVPEAAIEVKEHTSSEVTTGEIALSKDEGEVVVSVNASSATAGQETEALAPRGEKRRAEEAELDVTVIASNKETEVRQTAAPAHGRSKRQRTKDIAMGVFVGAVSTFATLVVMGGAQGE